VYRSRDEKIGRTRWDRASSESVELTSDPRVKAEPCVYKCGNTLLPGARICNRCNRVQDPKCLYEPNPTRPFTAADSLDQPQGKRKLDSPNKDEEIEEDVLSLDDLPIPARGVSRLLQRKNPLPPPAQEPTPPPREYETPPLPPASRCSYDDDTMLTMLSADDPSSKSAKSIQPSELGEERKEEVKESEEYPRKPTPPHLEYIRGSSQEAAAVLELPTNPSSTKIGRLKPEPSVEGIRANIDQYCAQKERVSPHDETLKFAKAGYRNSPRKISTSYKGHRIERFYSDLRTRGELVCWCLDANRLKMRVDKARLVRDGMGEKRTEYRLTVKTLEHRWHIWYRYSDYKQLDTHMCDELEDEAQCRFGPKRRPAELAAFPKKVWIGKNTESVQRERIRSFNVYMNQFLKHPGIITDNFIKFICQSAYISAKI